jgi:hypothetical protein
VLCAAEVPSLQRVLSAGSAQYMLSPRQAALDEAHYLVTEIRKSRGSGLPGRDTRFLRTRRQESLKGCPWHHFFERLRSVAAISHLPSFFATVRETPRASSSSRLTRRRNAPRQRIRRRTVCIVTLRARPLSSPNAGIGVAAAGTGTGRVPRVLSGGAKWGETCPCRKLPPA